GDPKRYLDALQLRMDSISSESPEMSVRLWRRAGAQFRFDYGVTEDGVPVEDAVDDPIKASAERDETSD
ncbi:MAG: hypothetical protein ACRDKA_14275, partial [Actinomycetota bacterium]